MGKDDITWMPVEALTVGDPVCNNMGVYTKIDGIWREEGGVVLLLASGTLDDGKLVDKGRLYPRGHLVPVVG